MDVEQKSFDFATEVIKQLITLASAIPPIMITFSKDFITAVVPGAKVYAHWSWGLFIASVLFGLLALMALTGTLAKLHKFPNLANEGIMTPSIRLFSGLQIVLFVVGLACLGVFGYKAS